MPIRPENKDRYPKNWKSEIRPRIMARSGGFCEFPGCKAENHKTHPKTGSKVVLTIAHLNHKPEDCDDDNLAALCQRCHNRYDMRVRGLDAYNRGYRKTIQHYKEVIKRNAADIRSLKETIAEWEVLGDALLECGYCDPVGDLEEAILNIGRMRGHQYED